MKKRIFSLIFLTCLGIGAMSGCGRMSQNQNTEKKESGTKQQETEMPSIPAKNPEAENKTSENEEDASASTVYMTTDITSEGLMDIYRALQASPEGNDCRVQHRLWQVSCRHA